MLAPQITGAGVAIATNTATSVNVALPVEASGIAARFVWISVTQAAFVRAGGAGVAASATDMICNANEKTVLNVSGCTNIAALGQGASGSVTVVPVQL